MRNLTYILGFIYTIGLITSCEKEIPWDTEEMSVMLVVEGSFTNELKKHQMKLSLSANYFYNQPTPKVSDAIVTLSDGTLVYNLFENPVGSGIYETHDSVAGTPGKTYTLDIRLREPVNQTTHYYATGEIIPGIEMDSLIALIYENPVYYSGAEDMDSLLIIIIAMGQEPFEIKNYYQLNLYESQVLINDTIDEVVVVDDKEGMNGEYVNSFFFFEQFDLGDTVQLEMISVEKNYFDFITGIQNIANLSFDPFNMSGPPSNASGNIQGAEAIGFFMFAYVSKQSAIAKFYEEDQ